MRTGLVEFEKLSFSWIPLVKALDFEVLHAYVMIRINPSYAGRDFSLVSRLVHIYQYPQYKIYCTHHRLKSRNDVTEQCSTVSTGYIFMLNMITCKLIFEHNIKHNRTSLTTLYASSRSKLGRGRKLDLDLKTAIDLSHGRKLDLDLNSATAIDLSRRCELDLDLNSAAA